MNKKLAATELLILSILTIFLLPAVAADPQEVKVGVYLLNIGKFDISTGTYTVDFYLSMKCKKQCSTENFEFMNGRATSIDKAIDLPTEKFYRIQANLNSPVDLKKFPFDSQKIQIILEDKKHKADELIYSPDLNQTGIDDSIAFPSGQVRDWTVSTSNHTYKIYDETYSQYAFTLNVNKVPWNAFMKTFLPVIFIILVILFSFILDPDKIVTRITLCSSSLLAAVMFHISISNQLPNVSYLTFADKFMLLTYFILVLSFIINISLVELNERSTKKNKKIAEKLHRYTEFSMLILVPLLYALLFWLFI